MAKATTEGTTGAPSEPEQWSGGVCGTPSEEGGGCRSDLSNSDAGDRSGRLRQRRGKLLFDLGRSRRYCAKLSDHYARLDKFSTLTSLISGSAVIVDVFAKWPNVQWIAGLIVMGSTLSNIVFGWSALGREFGMRRQRYTALLEQMTRRGDLMTEEEFRTFKADYIAIEADEPATKHNLMAVCHNEECGSRGQTDAKVRVWFWQRWFACWGDLPPSD